MDLQCLFNLNCFVCYVAQEFLDLVNFHLTEGVVLLTCIGIWVRDCEQSWCLGYAIIFVDASLTFFHLSKNKLVFVCFRKTFEKWSGCLPVSEKQDFVLIWIFFDKRLIVFGCNRPYKALHFGGSS